MIKQYLLKRAKVGYGLFNTYLRNKTSNYQDTKWWDNDFYTDGISDRKTIFSTKNRMSARYHYASIELQILKYFFNKGILTDQSTLVDIGSGAGHWIDFYRSLGVTRVIGMDVSLSAINFLKEKYSDNAGVALHHGKAFKILEGFEETADFVNAIGVMFHIVDDLEWNSTIKAVAKVLRKGGLFIAGGHFGLLDNLDLSINSDGQIYKRLRSRGHWRKVLRKEGFSNIQFQSNHAYLWINDTLPESNILIATK
jgi:SAM-dependent methyltransferase